MTADHRQEGWAFPGGSRKAHYFVGTMSLCRRWGFYTGPFTPNQQGAASPDDCATCRRELDKASTSQETPS